MKLNYDVADYATMRSILFDVTGKMLTTGLFEETQSYTQAKRGIKTPYVLEDWHKIYMEHCDVTEYGPAMELIGNWGHWVALRQNETLAGIFDEWKMEVEVKIRSESVAQLLAHAKQPGGTAAAKWLAEAGFNPVDLRHSKNKEREARIQDAMANRVKDDYARLTGGEP